MKKIKWIGPLGSFGGIPNASQCYVEALRAMPDVDLIIESTDGTFIKPWMIQHVEQQTEDDIEHLKIFHGFPAPRMDVDAVYTVFEFMPAPPQWQEYLQDIPLVFTPSKYSELILQSVTKPGRTSVVHHGVSPEFNQFTEPYDLYECAGGDELKLPSFLFLCVCEWVERKCPEILIQAFLDEFDGEDVGLVMKTSSPYFSTSRRIRQLAGNRNVFILDERLPMMAPLYRAADAYVSIGIEGWGETLLEAMACGIPTIGPIDGGSREFMTRENSYLVEMSQPIHVGPNRLKPLVQEWFKYRVPIVSSVRRAMRKVYEGTGVDEKVKNAIETSRQFTWEKATRTMLEKL